MIGILTDGLVLEEIRLRVSSVIATSSVTVLVTFDQAVDELTAENEDNYEVAGSPGKAVLAAELVDDDQVQLTVEEMLQGGSYTLNIVNVISALGRALQYPCSTAFSGVGLAPTVSLVSPEEGATQVPRDTNVVLTIVDTQSGVDAETMVITIEGSLAYDHDGFTPGWDGPESQVETITNGYRITIDPTSDFSWGIEVDLSIAATDNAGNSAA